ncbi:hypothetical protein DPMN_177864 [Dreissena polymorpha]|uniref:Uncharacterized protein n=1 Tax=Dreissena polymorpha TaxID=45954 RepID=A0A9D4E9I6_DREPO|nr:hypothetical protein DPMN_177864 [Dreissena polymorpha]
MSVFESLEYTNKPTPSPWKDPKDLAESKPLEGGKSYKSRVPDPTTVLDLSKLPALDPDINKLSLTMPVAYTQISVLYSMLENWELRERRSIGLANQLDLMAATALDMAWELLESVPEEHRALLIHLSRTTQFLSHNSASSMSEMLRFRRECILSRPPNILLEPVVNSLRTAPFTVDSLFGGRIQAAITADCEDQIHASLARNNSSQRQGAFKRPVSKSLAALPAKNAKKNNFFPSCSSILPPAPNRPSFYQNRPSSYKFSGKDSWKRANRSRIRRLSSLQRGQTSALRKYMAPNNFGCVGSFPCYKRPNFSI